MQATCVFFFFFPLGVGAGVWGGEWAALHRAKNPSSLVRDQTHASVVESDLPLSLVHSQLMALLIYLVTQAET